MPEPNTLHIDVALTNLAIAYGAGNLISEELFPDVMVEKRSDKYFTFDPERRAVAIVDTKRGRGAESKSVDYNVNSDSSYYTDDHALNTVIPDEDRENSDLPLAPEADAVEFLQQNVLTNQEVEAKAKLDAVLTGDQTSTPTNKWDDAINGDPYNDINTAISAIEDGIGQTPNVLALDSKVLRKLAAHPDLLDRIKYTGTGDRPAQVTARTLAELFNLEKVLVASAFKNIAVQGQTASISRVWGSDVYLGFVSPTPGIKKASLAYRFCWRPFSGGMKGYMVTRDRLARRKSDWIELSKYYDQKIVMAAAGYRFQSVLTA
jgi:hypothetical protein